LRVRDWHARDGRDLWALDLTADLGIPVIACVSRRVDAPFEDLLIGFGAHVDPGTALRHAVVEVNQFLPAVSRHTSTGQTMYSWPDHQGVRFWTEESLDTQPQLIPAPELPLRRLTDFPDQSRGDMLDVLEACVDVAQRQGMEVLVLDQSRPDVELRVARVVVPGLRHFWPRLGPGRLYEVPVRLGWIPAAKAEAELNPTSIFF